MGSFAASQWLIVLLIGIVPLLFFFKNLKKNLSNRSQNRFNQNSRFSRSEHGIRFLFFAVINVFISLLADGSYGGTAIILGLISISLVIYYFNIAVKRLHDLNMSGWYSLILIIPLSNFLLLLCLFFVKGSHSMSSAKQIVPENLRDDV